LVLLLFLPVLIANFAVSQIVRAIGAARQAMNGMILSIGINLLYWSLRINSVFISYCYHLAGE
jgi:Na+-driven multidrug efflux pump